MDQNKCIKEIKSRAIEIMDKIDMLKILTSSTVPHQLKLPLFEQLRPDIAMKVRSGDGKIYYLFFMIKSIGQPRYVRMHVNELKEILSDKEGFYGIFGAPYLTERSIRFCRENGIGFIDMSGNCLLDFDNIYVNICGKPNLYPTTRALKYLFTSKSTRALRALLLSPGKKWSIKELSQVADLSLGHTWNIKHNLLDNKFIVEHPKKKFSVTNVTKVEELLEDWAENYGYRKNKISWFYSPDTNEEIEKNFASYCKEHEIPYAFTLTSGLAVISIMPRKGLVFAYVVGSLEKIARDLRWKRAYPERNICLLEPYDKGVFFGSHDIAGMRIVCDVQLYLDFQSFEGQGGESTKHFLKKILSETDKLDNRRKMKKVGGE